MKVGQTELYPVYGWDGDDDFTSEYRSKLELPLTPEQVSWLEDVFSEWWKAQVFLKELYDKEEEKTWG